MAARSAAAGSPPAHDIGGVVEVHPDEVEACGPTPGVARGAVADEAFVEVAFRDGVEEMRVVAQIDAPGGIDIVLLVAIRLHQTELCANVIRDSG